LGYGELKEFVYLRWRVMRLGARLG
jgi:hypothetical protein